MPGRARSKLLVSNEGGAFARCRTGAHALIAAAAAISAVFVTGCNAPAPVDALPAARTALDRFMQARLERQNELVLSLLAAEYRQADNVGPNMLQTSNPCWYRYEVLRSTQTTSSSAEARVRLYSHNWGGDLLGGLPQSWEEEIGLVDASREWKVDSVSLPVNKVEEPTEPHGPTLSACTLAGRDS